LKRRKKSSTSPESERDSSPYKLRDARLEGHGEEKVPDRLQGKGDSSSFLVYKIKKKKTKRKKKNPQGGAGSRVTGTGKRRVPKQIRKAAQDFLKKGKRVDWKGKREWGRKERLPSGHQEGRKACWM